MNRVVVTGMGVVTPVGNDVKTFWDSLISGKCGVDFITKFDASDFKVRIAAEVKDFDPSLYMEKGEIRKTDLYAQYAMAAAVQAMEDSGLDGKVDPERLGVYIGSGIGGMQTFMEEHLKLLQKGARRIYAYTEDYNLASQHLCEKLGMRREGVFLEFISFVNNPDGTPRYENTVQYAILKKEWDRQQSQ